MKKTEMLSQRAQKWLVAVFFVILTAIGFLTVPDYGVPTDEEREIITLQYHAREYARLFTGDRDAAKTYFDARGVTEPSLQDYVDHSYGSALLYPTAPLMLLDSISVYLRMFLWHSYLFLVFMLGCWALYGIVTMLFQSRILGCAGVLLLYLSPLFFAEAHYNSKDTPMMAMTLVMLWQGARLMHKPSLPRALWFALAGAVATNQRVIGLALFGLIALFVLLSHLLRRKYARQALLIAAGATVAGFLGFYYILTPNAWGQPWMNFPDAISTFSRFGWDGLVLFRGTVYMLPEDPLPGEYILFLIGMTTPVPLLVAMTLGQLGAVKDFFVKGRDPAGNGRMLAILLCSLMWILPLAYFAIARPPVYNGWRHYQFVYGLLIIMAVYGLHTVGRLLKPRWLKGAGLAAVAAYLVITAAGMAQNHPYQFAYYNELVNDAAETEEGDYWFMAVHGAVRALLHDPGVNPDEPLSVSNFGPYHISALMPEELSRVEWLPHSEWRKAKYVLVGSRKWYVEEDTNYFTYEGLLSEFDEYMVVESYGNPVMYIYERVY